MQLSEVIDGIFNSISTQLLQPIGSNLYGILPAILWIALLVAVVATIAAALSGRPMQAVGGIVLTIVIALCIPYLPSVVDSAAGAASSASVPASSGQSAASSSSAATLGHVEEG